MKSEAEEWLATASKQYEDARRARDDAIRLAYDEGMSYRAIATVVGLSFQRVAQIVNAG